MTTLIKLMLKHTLSDKISLFYALLFPLGLMIGINYFVDSDQYILTGIISLSILFWNMQGLSFQIYRQKSKGIYQYLKITPMKLTSFITVLMIVRTFVSLLINLILLIIGFYILNFHFTTSYIIQCIVIIITASLCFSALGFLISNIAKNEGQINVFSNLLFLPMILCTDAFYSLHSIPSWMQLIGKCLPFNYVLNAFRSAINFDDQSILLSIFIILIFTVVFFTLGLFTTGKIKEWNPKGMIVSEK